MFLICIISSNNLIKCMNLIFSLKPRIRFVLPEDSCLEVGYLESAELVICCSAFAGRET